MIRQVVFDTETTGLKPEDGHRIIEIGAVELINGKKTGRTYYTLINPERHIPEEAVKIHHIDDEKVKDAPLFKEIADEFLEFIKGSELLIHNADFDIKFMNHELALINRGKIWDHVSNVVCTLKLSKRLFESERSHSLDSMCKRFGIDLSQREKYGHGALIDCQLLADCYIKINEIYPTEAIKEDIEQTNWVRPTIKRYKNLDLIEIKLSDEEENSHRIFLEHLEDLLEKFNKKEGVDKTSVQRLKI